LSLSLYDASIPVYARGLRNLAAVLDKAETWAKAEGKDLQSLFDARLAPDMHPLAGQIRLASDAAKGAAARLSGATAPSMPDTEETYAQLKDRVAKTIAYVETIQRADVEANAGATIELPIPGGALTFTAANFLFQFSLPNFFFHVTTAYDVLRSQGAPLGKMDFLAGGGMPG
jgi:uncharacterized protein